MVYSLVARCNRGRGRALHRTGLAATVLAVLLVGLAAMASTASATPVEGPAGPEFYNPPEGALSGTPGELLTYRPATVNLNVTLPANKAWNVQYQSTNQLGHPDPVTGTVIEPTAAWKGKGVRPVVTIGIGTQGLAQECAPSKQMEAGTEYDGGAIIAALKAGYDVVITDYPGYTTGSTPEYIAGKSEGQAVLDIVRAARELPGGEISSSAPTVAWGYSVGGQAVSWAGQLQPSYAPDVNLVGVAAGGTPANLKAVANFGNGSVAAGFDEDALLGLQVAYPGEFNLGSFVTLEGLKLGVAALEDCAIKVLRDFRDFKFETFSKEHKTIEQVLESNATVKRIIEEQNLGAQPVPVPVYHYHGLEDEFVPVTQDVELHQQWCELGVRDDLQLYPGDHLLTDPTAVPTVVKWIEERIAGKTAPSTCGAHKAGEKLPASARLTPETGDLIIPLPAWQLTGTVTEKKSGIKIEIPAGATLSAQGDITSEMLTANLSIPPLNQTIKVLGLPVKVKGSLTPTETITGTVGLTDAGVLSQSAVGHANMKVASIGVGLLTVPLGCTTSKPIALPLSISEPVNALQSGGFSINTEVTVPEFSGCGLFGGVLSSLMSGPENAVHIGAKPPPPVNW